MRGLVWFREDLRTEDNTALYHAAKQCEEGLIGVYVLDSGMWENHHTAACRVEFILRGLAILQKDLQQLNIPCLILSTPNTAEIPTLLFDLMKKTNCHALYFNRQYEINEARRDAAVEKYLQKNDLSTFTFDDQVLLAPGQVKTQQGEDFKVFTPYKRAWYQAFLQTQIKILPKPKKQAALTITTQTPPVQIAGFQSKIHPDVWPAGQQIAKKRLTHFIDDHLRHYDKERDFPALDHTSKLSPYLATGMISIRQCFLTALIENNNEFDSGNKGITTWLGELIWREFYKHLLVAAPHVSMGKPYKKSTSNIPWRFNEKQWQAWQQGQTGYPFIDAAMRQLNTTGWMHNRLRMVVAMFLTKNLFFDWHLGEKYFMQHLIDGDLAANNGGWQWSASTGTDAAPYFRIFNPIRQSERFDPDGIFIKKYCPELKDCDKKSIHEPFAKTPLIAAASGYPQPIIDLNEHRTAVLSAFKKFT